MFLGKYQHTIDKKGRLFIPARFRDRENQRFFITKGFETCLSVFPEEEWLKIQERFDELDMLKKDARAFRRVFFSGAAEVVCDRQGRINLPQTLISYAELGKEAIIVGISDRFEIWSIEKWHKYEEESSRRYEEIAEKLVE